MHTALSGSRRSASRRSMCSMWTRWFRDASTCACASLKVSKLFDASVRPFEVHFTLTSCTKYVRWNEQISYPKFDIVSGITTHICTREKKTFSYEYEETCVCVQESESEEEMACTVYRRWKKRRFRFVRILRLHETQRSRAYASLCSKT